MHEKVFCYGLTLHLESVKKKNPTAIVFTNGTDETCTTKSQGKEREYGSYCSPLLIIDNSATVKWSTGWEL